MKRCGWAFQSRLASVGHPSTGTSSPLPQSSLPHIRVHTIHIHFYHYAFLVYDIHAIGLVLFSLLELISTRSVLFLPPLVS